MLTLLSSPTWPHTQDQHYHQHHNNQGKHAQTAACDANLVNISI